MSEKRMPAHDFEHIIAPLYRQFAGFLLPNEMALHMNDRYRALGHYPHAALVHTVDLALETVRESRMPTIAWMREQCDGWMRVKNGGILPPRVRSEQCSLCVAAVGLYDNGRLGVLHERSCPHFDAGVRPCDDATLERT